MKKIQEKYEESLLICSLMYTDSIKYLSQVHIITFRSLYLLIITHFYFPIFGAHAWTYGLINYTMARNIPATMFYTQQFSLSWIIIIKMFLASTLVEMISCKWKYTQENCIMGKYAFIWFLQHLLNDFKRH